MASATSGVHRRPAAETAATETTLKRYERTLPWTVLGTNDFERNGVRRMNATVAARNAKEVAADPPGYLTALRFDIDKADAGTVWLDAGMPPPNIIVRRISNGHAHYIYQLGNWVRTDGSRGWREVRYASAIDAAMTVALAADTSYSGRFSHNPLHPTDEYETIVVRDEPYSLTELANHVDLNAPRRRNDTSSGIGRNVAVFDRTREWGRRNVLHYTHSRSAWDAAVLEKTNAFAKAVRAEFPNESHAHTNAETRATARSVSKWLWARYVDGVPRAVAAAQLIVKAERARLRAEKMRRAAQAKTRAEYLAPAAERRTRATELRNEGWSIRKIAEMLKCSASEIARLLKTLAKDSCAGLVRAQNLDPAQDPVQGLAPKSSSASSSRNRTDDAVFRRLRTGTLSSLAIVLYAIDRYRKMLTSPRSRAP